MGLNALCFSDNLEKNYPPASWYDKLFVHAPFSLWHGWIVFSGVINFFQVFTSVKEDGPGVWSRIFVIIGILFLSSTAIGYVEYKKKKGDVTGAWVIALGLLAIFTHQQDPWIHWWVYNWQIFTWSIARLNAFTAYRVALAASIFTFVYPARPYLFKLVGRSSDAENAPLLG